ncbi:MAG: hypothetical protein LBS96_06050 [Oscillospiraceae bacterium]|jgi:hypothetical protein|nr:hypothetical protein [Oscillospiraceae bacterium]
MNVEKRKRIYAALCVALIMVAVCGLVSPTARAAFVMDGVIGGLEWLDTPSYALVHPGGDGFNGIDNAGLRYILMPETQSVGLACLGQAPGAQDDGALGIVFYVDGREIAACRQGRGATYESENYFCEGIINILKRGDGTYNVEGDFTIELRIGCKSQAAFTALERLVVRLLDPNGEPSKDVSCPLRVPEPETTTVHTTTTREITTKAPTTEKTTTTKTTTTKITTTKTTTTKATTTMAVTTQTAAGGASVVGTTVPSAPSAGAETAPATPPPQSVAAPQAAPAAGSGNAQAGRPLASPALPVEEALPGRPNETLWDYPSYTLPATAALQAAAAQGASQTAQSSPRRTALFACGGVSLFAAAGMLLLWLRANWDCPKNMQERT